MNPVKKASKAAAKKAIKKPKAKAAGSKAGTKKPIAKEKSSFQPSHRLRPASKATADKQEEAKKEAPRAAMIRIRLSAFDHTVLDETAQKIIETAERSGAVIHGPIPLPTEIRKFTVNRSTFVHKDARDQFEMRTHRRLIDLKETTFKTMESLQNLSLPSGVDVEIKMS